MANNTVNIDVNIKNKSVGETQKTLKDLKTELKAVQNELVNLEEGSEAFNNAAKRAGALADQINDVREVTRNLTAGDRLDKGINTLTSAVQGLAGGFALAQGASALFGQENEDVNKALLKVNGAMAILNGLTAIKETLDKKSAFSTTLLTGAQSAYNTAIGIGTGSVRLFGLTAAQSIALATAGLSVLVTGVVLLISNFDLVIAKTKEFFGVQTQNNRVIKETIGLNQQLNKQNEQKIKDLDLELKILQERGETQDKIIRKTIELTQQEIATNNEKIRQNEEVLQQTGLFSVANKELEKVNKDLNNQNEILDARIKGLSKSLNEYNKKIKETKDKFLELSKTINTDLEQSLGKINLLDVLSKDLDDEKKQKELSLKIANTLNKVYSEIPEEIIEGEFDVLDPLFNDDGSIKGQDKLEKSKNDIKNILFDLSTSLNTPFDNILLGINKLAFEISEGGNIYEKIKAGLQLLSGVFDVISAKSEERFQNEINNLNKISDERQKRLDEDKENQIANLDRFKLTEEQRANFIREIENKNRIEKEKEEIKLRKQQERLEKEQARKRKRDSIIQATINGALAITNILATVPKADFGVATAILIGAAAATTAAQIGIIAAQKFNKGGIAEYNTGGKVRGPGTSKSDSIPAMLSNGESVINANSTRMFQPLLSRINEIGGGVRFATGGIAGGGSNNPSELFDSKELAREISLSLQQTPIRSFVVESEITSNQERIAQIKRKSLF